AGIRNRGIPAEALKDFCARIGVSKANSEVQISYLEACVRDYLNANAERAMGVLKPLKVTISNYPDGQTEQMDFEMNPNLESKPTRKISFSKNIYIDADDFSLAPPPKYFRLKKDGYVRLKNAYIIKCDEVLFNEDGSVKELICSYIPESRSGSDTSGMKVKGVIQWVDENTCVDVQIRQYGYLLNDEEYAGQDFSERMNANSVKIFNGKVEPYCIENDDDRPYQLMRTGYFKLLEVKGEKILSEIVSLKDNFNAKK
ncbi:MAG: glutamine--tRNA ligase, partial [Clostridia bacterium]|nr:glutamine--tRNA ligase [Clostridia bacterium]